MQTTSLSTRVRRYLTDPVATWRTGSRESQTLTLVVLLVGVVACFGVSLASYPLMPLTAYYVWLLLGMLLLRFFTRCRRGISRHDVHVPPSLRPQFFLAARTKLA